MDKSVFGTDVDAKKRAQLLAVRRVRIDISNQVPASWGDVYSIGWTVWFSYVELPAVEEHHSTVWLQPGQSFVLYSNQPANVDGGPCCKSLAWEFRVKGNGQALNNFYNTPPNECLVTMAIGVAPKGSILGATTLEIEQFGGSTTSKKAA